MLRRLYVRNYALIEEIDLAFGPGLNLLTGETGAGKSLLIGAIGLILGRRADPGVLLRPEEKCIVEASFAPGEDAELAAALAGEDLELDDGQLLIRRIITPSGKSRAFINDFPVTLDTLRGISRLIVSLHGQHEGQRLLDPRQQRLMLDNYAGLQTETAAFGTKLRELKQTTERLQELRQQQSERQQQEDYLRYQLDELEDAQLDAEEETKLQQEQTTLAHAEELKALLLGLNQSLAEGDGAVIDGLAAAERELERYADYHQGFPAEQDRLAQARFLVEEAAANLRGLAEDFELEDSAARLAQIEERLDVYNRLKVKFAVREASELTALHDSFAAQLDQLGSAGQEIERLEQQQHRLAAELTELGSRIEQHRHAAAGGLAARVGENLAAVGLEGASFSVAIGRLRAEAGLIEMDGERLQPDAGGFNSVQFMIRTNKGLPEAALAKTASGGEISRVMLAIKAALAERLALSVLIFDEIDTGISGEVARKVGRVMDHLAESHQLITITHLPQIACRPGQHFRIFKTEENGQTVSRIESLSADERREEIAMMLSGAEPTESARASARELLGE